MSLVAHWIAFRYASGEGRYELALCGESLRELARDYGMSYEAIRGIVRRSLQGAA